MSAPAWELVDGEVRVVVGGGAAARWDVEPAPETDDDAAAFDVALESDWLGTTAPAY